MIKSTKYALLLPALLSCIPVGNNAQAQAPREGFNAPYYTHSEERYSYAGIDYSYLQINYDDGILDQLPENFHGITPYFGFNLDKNFHVELGYAYYMAEEKDTTIFGFGTQTAEMSIHNLMLDFLARYPMAKEFEVEGGVGYVAHFLNIDLSLSGCPGCDLNIRDDAHSLRASLGMRYHITDDTSLRVMGRYNRFLTETEVFTDAYQLNAGISFKF